MALAASDADQLLGATAQGRIIFTFNARNFIALASLYPHHAGIALSAQKPMPGLLAALDRMLNESDADAWSGQVRWLNDWMDAG